MALNTCEMWFNGIKIAFFSKNCPTAASFDPRPPLASGCWGPRSQNLVCDTFELHKLSQHVSKVRYLHFLTISLSPLFLQNPG